MEYEEKASYSIGFFISLNVNVGNHLKGAFLKVPSSQFLPEIITILKFWKSESTFQVSEIIILPPLKSTYLNTP